MDRPRASSFGSFNNYRNERPRSSSLSFVSFQRYYTSDIHTKMAGAPANLALHVDEAERGRDGHLGGAGAGGMETSQSMHSVCSTTSPTSSNLQPLTPEGMDCYGNERQMLKEQAKFYNNPLLSDVTLKLGTSLYHAHKLILVRASEVFERMFSTEWANPDVKVSIGICINLLLSHLLMILTLFFCDNTYWTRLLMLVSVICLCLYVFETTFKIGSIPR